MAEKYPADPVIDNANAGFELRDTNLRAVLWFVVGLIISLVVIFILVGLLFDFFNVRQLQQSPPPPFMLEEAELLPPAPRLQRIPSLELEELRAREDAQLNSYGWVDQEAGIVRLPIERAMELALERGLPASSQSQEPGQ